MFRIIYFCVMGFVMAGCAARVESQLDSVRKNYMTEQIKDTDITIQDNLELLLTADALFHQDDFSGADKAYEKFNKKNTNITRGDIMRETSRFVFGANANEYRPFMMDTLFVHYYQLWAAIAEGRFNDARVIINQSYARQQSMSMEYAKLIESNQKNQNSELVKQIQSENSGWAAYSDIMNPALMYLSGIYFMDMGDFSDAELYLKRANGMVPENTCITQDLALAESHNKPKNTVWVFIEDGFAPKLAEKRTSLPFVSKNGVVTVTIAMSEPKFLDGFISINGAQKLADVDAMFMTEYGEYRINDATRAFAAAASRVVLQSTTQNSHSNSAAITGLLSTIYSEVTNSADVRTWATLPKTISVLRVQNNKSGLIDLRSGDKILDKISVPTDGNYLVYVRTTTNKNDIKIMKLK